MSTIRNIFNSTISQIDDLIKVVPPLVVSYLFVRLVYDFNSIRNINFFLGFKGSDGKFPKCQDAIGLEKLSFPFEYLIDKRVDTYNSPILLHFVICLLALGYIYVLLNTIIYLVNLSRSLVKTNFINEEYKSNLVHHLTIKLSPYLIIILSVLSIILSAGFIVELWMHRRFAPMVGIGLDYQDIFDIDGVYGIMIFVTFLILDLVVLRFEVIKKRYVGSEDSNKLDLEIRNAKQQIILLDIPAVAVFLFFELAISHSLFSNPSMSALQYEFFSTGAYNSPRINQFIGRISYNNQVFKELFSAGAVAFSLLLSQLTYTAIEVNNYLNKE